MATTFDKKAGARAASGSKPVLNLVKAFGEYFPYKEADYRLLQELQVPLCRITQKVFDLLLETHPNFKPRRLEIQVQPWVQIYPGLRDAFLASLPKEVKTKAESNTILLQIPDLPPEYPDLTVINAQIKNSLSAMQTYMGCYGFAMFQEDRDRRETHGYLLHRLTFQPSPDIIPSFHLGSDPLKPTSSEQLTLNPSTHFRINFTRGLQPNGQPSFKVSMTDVLPTEEHDLAVRSFPLKNITPNQCLQAIHFFTALYGTAIKEASKQ